MSNNKEKEEKTKEKEAEIPNSDIGEEVIKLLKERISIDRLLTNVVNLKDVRIPGTLDILKASGSGKVSEVAVISSSEFSIYIKADGKEIFNKNSDYTTLAELGGILNDIDADTSGANKRVVIRNINFIKSIFIQVNSDSEISAENIFCKYDLQIKQEEQSKKECSVK